MNKKIMLRCLLVTFITALFTLGIDNAIIIMNSSDAGNYALLNFIIYCEYYFSALNLAYNTIAGNRLGKCKTDEEFTKLHKKVSAIYNSYFVLTFLIKIAAIELIIVPLYANGMQARLCAYLALVLHLPRRVYSEFDWYTYKYKLDKANTISKMVMKGVYLLSVLLGCLTGINSIYLVLLVTYFDCVSGMIIYTYTLKRCSKKLDIKPKYYLFRQDFKGAIATIKEVLPETFRLMLSFIEMYLCTYFLAKLEYTMHVDQKSLSVLTRLQNH